MEEKRKYLEYFDGAFDSTVAKKIKLENKPYVAYSRIDGVVYTIIPEPIVLPPDNEIWYTSVDGNIVTPNKTNGFGANIVSNTYEDGKGVIKFDNNITSIGYKAFYNRSDLTSITIPNSVASIGIEAFRGCTNLTSITIPNSVTSIGDAAFRDCSGLKSITIPESVTSIGGNTFYECSGLKSITIPNSVTSIGEWTFGYCSGMTFITIGNSVTSIGDYSLYHCDSLTSVTIPNSVTNIGYQALAKCPGLTSITYEGTKDQWNTITKGDRWNADVPATYVQCSDGQVAI